MKIQNIFYTIGVVFIIAAVLYFTSEYLRDLPKEIKLLLLFVSVIVSFIIAELMRGSDV